MLELLVNGFITLFVIIDPPGLVPVFLTLTAEHTTVQRRQVALKACVVAALILTVFALAGTRILTALGITLGAFRVAGGLFLFWIAFELVFEKRRDRKQRSADAVSMDTEPHDDIAAVPLGIPLLAGPGAISAVILLSASLPNVVGQIALVAIIAIVMAITFAILFVSETLNHLLGNTGRAVISRLLGVLLAALAVQFVADGATELVAHMPAPTVRANG